MQQTMIDAPPPVKPLPVRRAPVRPAPARSTVISLDQAGFDAACAELFGTVQQSFQPDLLIAIPTGGLWVAEAMARSVTRAVPPILKLTCRRPSTQAKQGSRLFRTLLTRLPRPVLDRLRLLEHWLIARRGPPSTERIFDPAEHAALQSWFATSGPAPRILVVDDAVDSGATLAAVLAELRRIAPETASLRSAAVTITTPQPLVRPDFALFNRQLCRFPWSMDA